MASKTMFLRGCRGQVGPLWQRREGLAPAHAAAEVAVVQLAFQGSGVAGYLHSPTLPVLYLLPVLQFLHLKIGY